VFREVYLGLEIAKECKDNIVTTNGRREGCLSGIIYQKALKR
jgi:hypothetical protein